MVSVLVVDDHAVNREFIVTLLKHSGYRHFEAADGAEGLTVVRAEHPDLVICDVLMPTMDGFEFVRQLRADPAVAGTKVIFYTAHYLEREAWNLAKSCGVLQVLVKPCEPERVLNVIEQALAQDSRVQGAPGAAEFDRAHVRVMTDKLSAKVEELQLVSERLSALTELNLQLASERDPRALLEKVCHGARQLLGAKFVILGARDKNGEPSVFFAVAGLDEATALQLKHPPLDQGALGRLLKERQARRFHNPGGDPREIGLPESYPPIHSCILAPIISLGHAYGWICLIDKLGADEFSEDDLRTSSILGAQVGRIYENGSLYAAITRHAAELQISRERLAGLIGSAMDAIVTVDEQQRIVVFNAAAEQMFGYTAAEMEGQAIDCLFPERFRAAHATHLRAFGETGVAARKMGRQRNVVGLRKTGEEFPTETSISRTAIGDRKLFTAILRDVTERTKLEESLRESERRYSDMLGNVELISLMLDREGHVTYCNDYLLRLTGWRREEVIGNDWFERFVPPPHDEMRKVFDSLLKDLPDAWHNENDIVTRAGERRLIRWNNTVLRSASGPVTGVASIGEDITEQKRADEKVRRLNRVYAVLSGINTLIVRVKDREVLYREACRIAVEHGHFELAWIGIADRATDRVLPVAWAGDEDGYLALVRPFAEKAPDSRISLVGKVMRTRAAVVCNDITPDSDVLLYPQEAVNRGFRSVISLPLTVDNDVIGSLTLFAGEPDFFDAQELALLNELSSDISFALETIKNSERLNYLAYFDGVTGLANRTLFRERIGQMLNTAERESTRFAVAIVNIERFKTINDSLGRQAGDALLKQIAERARCAIADSSLLACTGGDHFAVIFPAGADAEEVARRVTASYREIFDPPFELNGSEFRVAARIGIAMYPDDGNDAETLLRNAESAMKKSKGSGERLLFYTEQMTERVAERLSLENKLRRALESEEFVLHYQPKVDLATGAISGVEALIRWNDPETGMVPPAHFIPLLEETGLIREVGSWAMMRAVLDHRHWLDLNLPAPRIAVNVSPIQLRQRDFVEMVKQAIAFGASPPGIDLEITESLIMEDVEGNIAKLQAIRDLGMTIFIDDFGTGYSSLGYLAKLPVHSLKIDRSFVITMLDDPNTMSLVSTIITLAHSLKLKVVAEGVDKEEQARILRLLRCEEMQGYLFSKPVPRDQLTVLLARKAQ